VAKGGRRAFQSLENGAIGPTSAILKRIGNSIGVAVARISGPGTSQEAPGRFIEEISISSLILLQHYPDGNGLRITTILIAG
jgi:hypothetical protein